jgi:hypothetical protein
MLERTFLTLLLLNLFAALSCGWFKPTVDQAKFEPAYKAMKSIQGATAVGVNYMRFGELLGNFATEVSIAADKTASDKEREILVHYATVLVIYNDSYTIWRTSLSSSRSELLPQGRLVISEEIAPIVDKYYLPLKFHTFYGINYRSIDLHSSLQKLWDQASTKMNRFRDAATYIE